jgi:hypothetical protein
MRGNSAAFTTQPTTTTLITHVNMNRMSRCFENAPEDQYGDFFIVAGDRLYVTVTCETAAQIEAVLERAKVPEWIVFDDRVGSRFKVRTCHIRSIVESTAEQRAADRRFDRARQREEKEDRNPWEEYD